MGTEWRKRAIGWGYGGGSIDRKRAFRHKNGYLRLFLKMGWCRRLVWRCGWADQNIWAWNGEDLELSVAGQIEGSVDGPQAGRRQPAASLQRMVANMRTGIGISIRWTVRYV